MIGGSQYIVAFRHVPILSGIVAGTFVVVLIASHEALTHSLSRDRCGFTLDGAYQHVKSRRPWIQPNRAFVGQLRSFDMVRAAAHDGSHDLVILVSQ
jgi:hypothetical protein